MYDWLTCDQRKSLANQHDEGGSIRAGRAHRKHSK
jgi:hypothetical protein